MLGVLLVLLVSTMIGWLLGAPVLGLLIGLLVVLLMASGWA